ncbi:hypothetical protein HAX54_044850 [Datura stramonium]|uniref:WAT1-related protein n=1 Tax=Datura stramonium TaxID=4076 RepID=A0ABS8RPR0_DATST|nr:hypothetical protein [Datura stramonium]
MGKEMLVFVVMVIVQFGFAGMIIISKLVMDGGMNPFVQSAYKPIFATISIAPFAFFFERPRDGQRLFFSRYVCVLFSGSQQTNMYISLG